MAYRQRLLDTIKVVSSEPNRAQQSLLRSDTADLLEAVRHHRVELEQCRAVECPEFVAEGVDQSRRHVADVGDFAVGVVDAERIEPCGEVAVWAQREIQRANQLAPAIAGRGRQLLGQTPGAARLEHSCAVAIDLRGDLSPQLDRKQVRVVDQEIQLQRPGAEHRR